jgi:hypothetical protein
LKETFASKNKTVTVHPEMHQRLRTIVLILMLAMAVASPFMQLDSWDNFPVATGDIELQTIMDLCMLGMFFVFASVLVTLFPSLLRFSCVRPPTARAAVLEYCPAAVQSLLFGFSVPLRN